MVYICNDVLYDATLFLGPHTSALLGLTTRQFHVCTKNAMTFVRNKVESLLLNLLCPGGKYYCQDAVFKLKLIQKRDLHWSTKMTEILISKFSEADTKKCLKPCIFPATVNSLLLVRLNQVNPDW